MSTDDSRADTVAPDEAPAPRGETAPERPLLAKPGRQFLPRTRTAAPAKAPAEDDLEDPHDEYEGHPEDDEDAEDDGPVLARSRGAAAVEYLDATSVRSIGYPAVRLDGPLPQWCTERAHAAIWPAAGWWTGATWPGPHEKVPSEVRLLSTGWASAADARERWTVLHGQIVADGEQHVGWLLALDARAQPVSAWRTTPAGLSRLLTALTGSAEVPDEPLWSITRDQATAAAQVRASAPSAEPWQQEPPAYEDEPPADEDELAHEQAAVHSPGDGATDLWTDPWADPWSAVTDAQDADPWAGADAGTADDSWHDVVQNRDVPHITTRVADVVAYDEGW